MENNNIVFVYDDCEFSNENVNEKIKNIFNSIEKFNKENNKKFRNLYFNENYVKISNNYYNSILNYSIFPLSNIENFNVDDFQSLILFFNKNSIENKMFDAIKNKINVNNEICSIIIFEENRDDLCEIKDYNKFVEDTLDYHFEIICDIANFNDFNEDDDGIGTFNLSLHSFNWKFQNLNNNNKNNNKNNNNNNENNNENNNKNNNNNKENNNNENNNNNNENINNKNNNNENNNENNKKIINGKEYNKLNDEDEIEKLFTKIKEIKEINKSENISMEERRNNAEKAIYMLMDMFGLDEPEENEEKEE